MKKVFVTFLLSFTLSPMKKDSYNNQDPSKLYGPIIRKTLENYVLHYKKMITLKMNSRITQLKRPKSSFESFWNREFDVFNH